MLISKYRSADMDMEEALMAFENQYSISIPDQYRKFLLRYNGGDTPKTSFKINKEDSDIRAFYGLGTVRYSFDNIEKMRRFLTENVLPIACDSFGNYIVIGLTSDAIGKIYFCDHEQGMKQIFLTETLGDFVRKCKSSKLDTDCTLSVEERERLMIAAGDGDLITDFLRRIWRSEIEKYGGMKQERVIID